MIDDERIRLIGKLFSVWNDPQSELIGNRAMSLLHGLFTDSDLKVWREYIKLSESEKAEFQKETIKELEAFRFRKVKVVTAKEVQST